MKSSQSYNLQNIVLIHLQNIPYYFYFHNKNVQEETATDSMFAVESGQTGIHSAMS